MKMSPEILYSLGMSKLPFPHVTYLAENNFAVRLLAPDEKRMQSLSPTHAQDRSQRRSE
jgi:hypothetical protein